MGPPPQIHFLGFPDSAPRIGLHLAVPAGAPAGELAGKRVRVVSVERVGDVWKAGVVVVGLDDLGTNN